MLLLALRSLFFVVVILGYSTGVWRLINDYFGNEFKSFLQEEVKKNKYILVDPAKVDDPSQHQDNSAAGSSTAEIISESEVRRASGSITANRLLDEMIIRFGRFFTTRNEREFNTGKEKETQQNQQQTNPPPEATITNKSPQQQLQQQQESTNDNAHHQDPPGAGPATVEHAIIESDKFVESSSSSSSVPHQAAAELDNKSAEDDDEEAAEHDEEAKWIKYWKNRGQQRLDTSQDDGGGYCGATGGKIDGEMKGLAMDDACGT